MGQKTFAIPPDRAKYFSDIDGSILKWSMELGRAVLQADSIKETLGTLYQSRQKNMLAVLAEHGLDPSLCTAAKLGPDGNIVVEMQDGPPT